MKQPDFLFWDFQKIIKIFISKISKKMLNQTVCFQNPVCFQIPLDVQPDERNGLRTPIWSVRALIGIGHGFVNFAKKCHQNRVQNRVPECSFLSR